MLSQLDTAESHGWVWKVLLTRGSAGRGYRPDPGCAPLRVSSLYEWPSYGAGSASDGLALRTCETRLGQNPSLAGMKHLCRLEQVMARREWSDPTVDEGLMLDSLGQVIEATSSNLFLHRGRQLITPSLDLSGVTGVVRGLILDLAEQQNTPVLIRPVKPRDLSDADGLYLCNSIAGIRRVKRWEGREYDLRLADPAPIVSAMQKVHSPC